MFNWLIALVSLILGLLSFGCTNIFTSEPPVFEDEAWRDTTFFIEGLVYVINDSQIVEVNPNTFEERILVEHDFQKAVKFRVNQARTKALCRTNGGLTEYSLISGKKLRDLNVYISSPSGGAANSYFFGYLGNDTTIWYLENYQEYRYRINQIGPEVELMDLYIPPQDRIRLDVVGLDISENNDLSYSYKHALIGGAPWQTTYSGKIMFADSINNKNLYRGFGIEETHYLEWDNNEKTVCTFFEDDYGQGEFKYFTKRNNAISSFEYRSEIHKVITRNSVMGPSGKAFLIPTESEDGKGYLYVQKLIKRNSKQGYPQQYNAVKVIKTGINVKSNYFDWE